MTFQDKINILINKGVNHLNQIHEAGSSIRMNTFIGFFVLNTDNLSDKRLKNIHLLTCIATIAWNTAEGGKYE